MERERATNRGRKKDKQRVKEKKEREMDTKESWGSWLKMERKMNVCMIYDALPNHY